MAEDEQPTRRVVKKRVVKKAAPAPPPETPTPEPPPTQKSRTPKLRPSKARTTKPRPSKARTPKPRPSKARTPKPRISKPSASEQPSDAPRRTRLHLPTAAPNLPEVPPRAALAICGSVTGLIAVGLTTLGMFLFDLVRGTSTGSGIWGFVALVAVIVLTIGAGSFLLGALRVPQSRLTALVGVMLVLIVVLAGLLDVVFSPWMWLVIPALTAVAYLLSHSVLTRTEG